VGVSVGYHSSDFWDCHFSRFCDRMDLWNIFHKEKFSAQRRFPLMQSNVSHTFNPPLLGRPTVYSILFMISLVHLLNDSMQSVIPAIFPILRNTMDLSYVQIGWIGFAINATASLMQPVIGLYSDKHPSPFLLPVGMLSSLLGMLGLALAPNYAIVILSVIFVGIGSAVFHPEASRVAYLAAGSRRGLAQSIYQVGGNSGQALAPLLTILIFIPLGQFGAIWFTVVAGTAALLLVFVARWYRQKLSEEGAVRPRRGAGVRETGVNISGKQVKLGVTLLVFLVFARSWFHAGISNYYHFYLMERYGISLEHAQFFILLFMVAGVFGTFLGGPLSDRFGRRNMIWFSMLGAVPLALLLPHISLAWAYPVILLCGFIILSSFSVTVVYAQELVPGKIGTVSGLILGFAFGMGAVGSLVLGWLADLFSLRLVMIICGFLPLLGLLTFLLPSDRTLRGQETEAGTGEQ
jgi:FSR family fosmidomycin resistance protein-like MFS transporter